MNLSRHAKESIKTALAMTIAYGIALSMNWDNPKWAGFAVAMVSLATIGQSLNKAALRMAGTLVGMAVALLLIALFAQDRWPFIVFLSLWIGLCTYMMGGARHQYFWHVCGFVCTIICMSAGPDSANAFAIAVLRTQETGLGILVYSLVSILLWPVSSRTEFEASVSNLASTQHRMYTSYLALMQGKGDAAVAQSLRAEAMQQQAQFSQLLDAAEGDSYEVRELRAVWCRYRGQVKDLAETLEQWREGFTELQALDMDRLLPNLASFTAELDRRFVQIEGMLAGQRPETRPAAAELLLDMELIHALPHFHKAALAVTRRRLLHLEALTRSLFDNIMELRSFGDAAAVNDESLTASGESGFIPDPDRLTAAFRAMLTLWLAWFTLTYVNDVPGGTGLVIMGVSIGMALATMPQLAVSKLFMPVANSILFAGCLYIFVMPKLSSFSGLGLLIFAATFAICYVYAAPQKMLGRAIGLALFISIAGISNDQSYSFLVVANTAMMFAILLLIFAIAAYIPFSPRPERAVLRLLGRFFRSSEYLMANMRGEPGDAPGRLERWRTALHARDLAGLPQKVGVWTRFIDTRALPGTETAQVQSIVTRLQALANRVQELIELRGSPQAEFLLQELLADFHAWHLGVQDTLRRLSQDPATGDPEAFRGKLDAVMMRLETRIREALDRAPENRISDREAENFYRLLGAYRGVSEALVDYARSASGIDWERWREERFA